MANLPYKNTAYALGQSALQTLAPLPVIALRAPTTADTGYDLGTEWINKSANTVYTLTSVAAGAATWTQIAGGGMGTVTSITAGTGLTGTPNPITTTGTIALTVPVVIANGGTNATSMTNTNGVNYFDGTRIVTTTVGTAGQVLTSNGAGVAPTFQAAASGNITITGDTGGGLVGNSFTFTGGTTGLLFGGAGTTETLSGTLVVSNGGSGRATATAYAVICGGTTATGAHQSIASVGTAGQVLTSNGAGALPTFQAVTATAAGSNTQIQYNNAGSLGANANFVFVSAGTQLGVGTSSPAASSLVDFTSTAGGFLLPRMTTTQKNAISSPATSLQVFDSTLNESDSYRTISASNTVLDTGAANTTTTSSAGWFPYWVGNWSEIANLPPLSTTPFTSNVALTQQIGTSGFFVVYTSAPANAGYIDYATASNLAVGTYMVEYCLSASNNRAIVDVAVKLGGGGYTIIRNQVDLYYNSASDGLISVRDFFYVTTSSSCNLRWTANGKNGSSSNYFIVLSSIRLTKVG